MQLLHAKNKVVHLPNADEVIEKIQQEYELMKEHLLEYYQAKKALLDAKRKQLVDQQLLLQVEELKTRFLTQQKSWKSLTASYS